MTLTLLELYPSHLTLNGDMGNGIVLARRAALAGLEIEIARYDPGADLPARADLVTVGTGSSSAQLAVGADIARIASRIADWVDAGVPLLAVGAGMHLLGRSLELADGGRIEGAGVFPLVTRASTRVVTDAFTVDTGAGRLIGVENHAAAVELETGAEPFGTVVNGRGNDGRSEGVRVGEAIGTHLHGPVLALNPVLADHLLSVAASRAGSSYVTTGAHDEIDSLARRAREHLARSSRVPLDAAG